MLVMVTGVWQRLKQIKRENGKRRSNYKVNKAIGNMENIGTVTGFELWMNNKKSLYRH